MVQFDEPWGAMCGPDLLEKEPKMPEVEEEDYLEMSMEDAAMEALRQYSKSLEFAAYQGEGPCSSGKKEVKQQLVVQAESGGYDVPADLYPYLGMTSTDTDLNLDSKLGTPTKGRGIFCYAGSLEKQPPLALFDIRDEVCLSVGGFRHGQVVRDDSGGELVVIGVKPADGTPRLWFQPKDLGRAAAGAFPDVSAADLRAKFKPVAHTAGRQLLHQVSPSKFDTVEDADGERLCLCRYCRLPLGSFEGASAALAHGECVAQLTERGLRGETEARQREAGELKSARRAEYEIGWKVERIPRGLGLAKELAGAAPQHGMVCLVLDGPRVRVAPTLEPAAAVNLEYLALTLQVRLLEGKEPLFSLDPVDPSDYNSMQEKRFEPAWLAGTSVGEVLFQADYHLKELSMGGCEQPVLGMQSCFDISAKERQFKAWNAREWFVVNKAQISLSEDGALIPSLKMGVEAREQRVGPNGMEDIKVTKADHPLVHYADAFTDKFDLIAERKSVIHQLRELAKASVLAKFLLDNEIQLEDVWFEHGAADSAACCLEIPPLWNERYSAQLRVQDGHVVDAGDLGCKKVTGVYGGVEFGIDKFDLSQPTQNWRLRSAVAPAMPMVGLRLPAPRGVAAPVIETTLARAAPRVPGVPVAVAVPRFSKRIKGVGAARGVDLSLDRFDLSTPEQVASQVVQASEAGATLGGAFWASLSDQAGSVFNNEDKALLRKIFDPLLSDRRDEGEHFVPPDTSATYVEELRRLVDEEEGVRQGRRDHFLSAAFSQGTPGPLFPLSWSLEGKAAPAKQLRARADYKAAAPVFEKAMKSAAPVYDKTTEDGSRFRIYRFGSVEVRTTQDRDGAEVVGEIFSACAPKQASCPQASEAVIKVTEFVEKAPLAEQAALAHQCYVMLETTSGQRIIVEKCADGSVAWEGPEELEHRNSLAKIVRSATCTSLVTVGDLKEFLTSQAGPAASPVECKIFAQEAFCLASGSSYASSGFRQPKQSGKWQLSMEGQGGWHGASAQRYSKQTIRVRCGK